MRMLLMLALLVLLPLVAATPEREAPLLDDRVESVGHDPAVPQPGEQWTGHLRLVEGHNVTEARYQICEVGIACFAPPTPMTLDADGRTFRFDTRDYVSPVNGEPVAWGIDDGEPWNVGFRFLLISDQNLTELPEGLECDAPENQYMEYVECDATHYFVFTMPGATQAGEAAPGPALPLLLVALAFLALRRP